MPSAARAAAFSFFSKAQMDRLLHASEGGGTGWRASVLQTLE